MKRRISIILLLIATLMFSLLAFTACGNGNGDKQVPVYQGMTIATNSMSGFASYRMSDVVLLSADYGNIGDNGNHNGHYKGDHADKNDTIDEDNPYPDNNANENIEEEIKSSLNVVGSPDTIYYATPNQDIYINIHIDNPDSFEIMSFTLNGKKYSSYMFEEGSDMETIVLKYNVGDTAGIVEYTIDAIKYIDGTEIKDVIIDGNKTVMAGIRTENQVVASVTDVDIDTNALSFTVDVIDINSLVEFSEGALKAVVYDGFNIVSEKDIALGENAVTFNGLKTNTLYQYAIVGYYDDLSGDGFGMNVLYKDAFYTDSVVLFDNITVGQEGVSFGYLWHEDHQSKAISSLKLYKGDNFVKDLTANVTTVSELLSNTAYKLVAEYPNADNTESIYLEFTTLAKSAPSFAPKNESIMTDSISAEYDVTDVDSILSSYKVELYKGENLVSENTEKKISFASLDYYTNYTLKITYTYDLNDGKGVQTKVFEKAYKTLPYIDVIECNIVNTSAVSERETIYMQVKLDNPLGMKIESVVINGATYSVTGASTANKIFVEIVYNGQFEGGDTYLKVDQVNAKLDGVSYTVAPKTELADNVFINGKLEVSRIEFVNEDFEPINWAFPSDTVYVLITLDNPTGYIIDAVNTNITELIKPIKIDDNRWYYEISLNNGINEISLNSLDYHNASVSKTLTYSNMSSSCYRVKSDTPVYVSKSDDLKNMDGGYYYELTGDIDLAGIEWVGNALNGVFDGKGFAIKNMSFVGTVKNKAAYLGLFSYGTGVIQNLNVKDATVIAEVTADDGNCYGAYCGALAAEARNFLHIQNCTVDAYSIFDLKNTTGEHCYAGGLVGCIEGTVTITNCTNSGSVSSTGQLGGAGGLVGCFSSSTVTITNCTNNGSVSATYYAGGLVGYIVGFTATITNCTNNGNVSSTGQNNNYAGGLVGCMVGTVTITNCTNNGNISSTGQGGYAGGLVGYINSITSTITNCTNNGNVSLTGLNNNYAGGLVGYIGGTVTITNCTNNGNVSLTGEWGYAGGLVGCIEGNVTITNCTNNGNVSSTGPILNFAGGLVGCIERSTATMITNCINSGSVSATSEAYNAYAGGLVGCIELSTATITNCTNSGSVSATSEGNSVYAGGLVGCISCDNVTITNCTNNGNVSLTGQSYDYAGGLVGFISGDNVTITNCINSGSVSLTSQWGWAGGLVGYINDGSTATITNCYSIDVGNNEEHGETCTVEQLNSKEFYTETLGWSEDVWDFSELDVENGKYPELK